MIVQKFGGTSVGTIERIKASANIVKSTLLEGERVIVVVSAMAGETDRLIDLHSEITKNTPQTNQILAERDAIISTGEEVCAGLFASFLNSIGVKAASFNGLQTGIFTNSKFFNAKIECMNLEEIEEALNNGITPVITGFQGFCIETKRKTTLGRGGSDTSAIAIAAYFNAKECQVYKDVDGVMNGDPKIITNPSKISEISYDSMLNLSSTGAKVLERRSVNFAAKYKIPISVLSSFIQTEGTKIQNCVNEKAKIESISLLNNHILCYFKSSSRIPEVLKMLQKTLISYKIVSIESKNNENTFNIVITKEDANKINCTQSPISKISIIGYFLQSDSVLERASDIIYKQSLTPILTTISETVISFFLKEEKGISELVQILHQNLINE